jgi:hypothetical protein
MATDDRAPWEEGWDKSLPFLSCKWLTWASNHRWHQFRNGDPTAFAVHKARKSAYRKCAHEVRVYEAAIVARTAELRRLRSQAAKFEALAARAAKVVSSAPSVFSGGLISELAELAPKGADTQ